MTDDGQVVTQDGMAIEERSYAAKQLSISAFICTAAENATEKGAEAAEASPVATATVAIVDFFFAHGHTGRLLNVVRLDRYAGTATSNDPAIE
ncbi:MAG: hypothetical protein M1838_005618 [Thelocarpon superellum]|nr:MAG: hypothetical protein M1838_005618 [Thelocarpon superellum]